MIDDQDPDLEVFDGDLDPELAVFNDDTLQAELIAATALAKFGTLARKYSPGLKTEHFSDLRLRDIARASFSVMDRAPLGHERAEYFVELVIQELDATGQLAAVGGASFVMGLWLHQGPSVAELAQYWSAKVIEFWRARESVSMWAKAQKDVLGGESVMETWKRLGDDYRSVIGPDLSQGEGI